MAMQYQTLGHDANGNPIFNQDIIVYTLVAADGTTTLANGGTAQDSVQINSDSDFFAQKVTYWASSSTTYAANPGVTMQLTDAGSNKNIFDQAQFISSIAGSGELPFMLPMNRKFTANTIIQAAFTNVTSATTYDYLYVSLIGVRRYLA